MAQALGELLGSCLAGVDGALQIGDGRERGRAQGVQAAVHPALQPAPQGGQRHGTVVGIIAEAAGSATTVALGWYAWRRSAVS